MPQRPEWLEGVYGGHDPDAWDEALGQCREVLIVWARSGEVHTYKDLSEAVDAVPWSQGHALARQATRLLSRVSYDEWAEGRPLLSAMVINARTRRPGPRFFDLCREDLGMDVGGTEAAEKAFWQQEVQRCHDYWRDHP